MKKLLCLLAFALSLSAADLVVNVTKTVDNIYTPTFKTWLACTIIGPNVGDLSACSASDLTDRQATDWLVEKAENVIDVFVKEKAVPWAELNRVTVLPLDHQGDVTTATTAVADRNTKRERATR